MVTKKGTSIDFPVFNLMWALVLKATESQGSGWTKGAHIPYIADSSSGGISLLLTSDWIPLPLETLFLMSGIKSRYWMRMEREEKWLLWWVSGD